MKNKDLLSSIKSLWLDVAVNDLLINFENFASYREKTEPTAGSPTYLINKLNIEDVIGVTNKIKINKDSIVFFTDQIVVKFWKKPQIKKCFLLSEVK